MLASSSSVAKRGLPVYQGISVRDERGEKAGKEEKDTDPTEEVQGESE